MSESNTTEADKKVYTLENVKEHNNAESLWIILYNKIYDVTKFQMDHPGGDEILLENAGTIATQFFEDIGHSQDARNLLKTYYIGDLDEKDHPHIQKDESKKASAYNKRRPPIPFVLAILGITLCTLYFFLFRKGTGV